ncbi:MAG: hypothetical protein WDZ43_00480 [Nitrosopumilaceae archaeon]
MNDTSIGLVLVSDDISKDIGNQIIELRSKKSTPLSLSCLHWKQGRRGRL